MPNTKTIFSPLTFLLVIFAVILLIFILIELGQMKQDVESMKSQCCTTESTETSSSTTTSSKTPDDTCDSDSSISANGKESISIDCGDTVLLSLSYTPSTGYEPYNPVYDKTVFELIDTQDSSSGNDMPGGDSTTRTYKFKSLKSVTDSKIEIGIYRSWEGDSSKEVKESLKVTVK